MTVQPYDTAMYHGECCVVEQVWEADDEKHTPFCALRELDNPRQGMYFVEQSSLVPMPRSHHYPKAA